MIENASVVWAGLKTSDATKLERVNRKAARLIAGLPSRTSLPHDLLLARAGLSELSHRRNLSQALVTHRFADANLPPHVLDGLAHWLPDSDSEKHYILRRNKALRLPRAKKNVLKLSPLYSAVTTWNSLPSSLLANSTVESIKTFFS